MRFKLPFIIVKRRVWEDKHQYRLDLEDRVDNLIIQLAEANEQLEQKKTVLELVEKAMPTVRENE